MVPVIHCHLFKVSPTNIGNNVFLIGTYCHCAWLHYSDNVLMEWGSNCLWMIAIVEKNQYYWAARAVVLPKGKPMCPRDSFLREYPQKKIKILSTILSVLVS